MKKKIGAFEICCLIIFSILSFLTVYPFIYAASYSLSNGILAMKNNISFFPIGFTFDNYKLILNDERFFDASFISISRTITGTILHLIITGICAYAISKRELRGKKFWMIFFTIPMYVSGGMLPYYVLIHDLGLMNNFLVYIIPTAFSAFNMYLMKAYFETIPSSLEESAKIDGAGTLYIFIFIYFPLSLTVVATIALYTGVMHWNSWTDTLLYITNRNLYPLQMLLQNILRETQIDSLISLHERMRKNQAELEVSSETVKMAMLILTTLPIAFIYPFAQKYFIKGMMIGAVKA